MVGMRSILWMVMIASLGCGTDTPPPDQGMPMLTALVGDWFLCDKADCSTLRNHGAEWSVDGTWVMLEARGCGFFRSLELVDGALVDRVRAATRARGVIVRTDVRANPCLAISPPLISDRSHVDQIAEALAGGLAEIAG